MSKVKTSQTRALQNAARQRKEELGKAIATLGGSNSALVPNYAANDSTPKASLPVLEKAFVEQYEQRDTNPISRMSPILNTATALTGNVGFKLAADMGSDPSYQNSRQQTKDLYNEIKNREVQKRLENSVPEIATMPTIMGMSNAAYGLNTAGVSREDAQRLLDKQNREKNEKKLTDLANSHPVLASVGAVVSNPIESIEGDIENAGNYLMGKPLNETYTPSQTIRETVTENINSKPGKFLYGVGNSMADMGLATVIGAATGNPNIAAGIMGSEKANQVMNDAISRGLNPDQIVAEGGLSGVSTALTERVPLEKLLSGDSILRAAAREGGQEALEDIADSIFDEFVTRSGNNKEKSDLSIQYQAYINAGYSEEEARKAVRNDYLKQLGLDALAGAISGGTLQGGTNFMQGRNIVSGNERVKPETNTETEQTIPKLSQIEQETQANNRANEDMEMLRLALANQPVNEVNNVINDKVDNVKENVELPTVQPTRSNPENVVYHAGKFSKLNKAESNGRFAGSNRGTGYFGTGHYFVDNNTLNELQQGGYQNQPLTSVDISGYNNLFRADTDEKANNLHNFLQDMTRYTQGSDKNSVEELYNEYLEAFKDQDDIIPFEDFESRLSNLKEYMGNSKMDDRGDSVSTQFMKSLGYGGVDTRGTRYADTRYGTVIYDVDENSVLQGNIPALERANTDMLTRSENRNVFDTEEDARIQSILDGQKKNAEIEARTREIFDDSKLRENENTIQELQTQRQQVQNIIDDVTAVLSDPEGYVNDLERDFRELDIPVSEEEHAQRIEETINNFTESLENRESEIASIDEQIATLENENKALYDEYVKAKNQAKEEINNSVEDEGLDEDVKNIKTMEEASTAIGNELEGLDGAIRMDTGIFSENKGNIPNLEKDNGVHTGKFKTSKFATNTYPNSGAVSEEEYTRVISDDIKQYEAVTHESTLNKAEENVKKNGYTGEYNRLLNDDNWDAVDVDTAMLCAMKAADEARAAEAMGVDSNEAWSREVGIFKKARKMATAGGQMIEAFKKWSAMTAEGKLAQAISFVNEVVKEEKNELDLPKDVKTAAEKYLSDEVMAEFLKKAHQYDGQDVSLLKQARLNAELAHMINEQIPVKFRAKFTSLWLDNLLASFRTLISRNFGGNIGKAGLDQTLVKAISGPIDKFISKFTGTRTTTGWTREGWKEYKEGFKQAGKQTFKDYWTPNADPDAKLKLKDLAKEIDIFADANVTNRAGVDELNFKESLKGNRTTFKNKALKLYDKVIKFGLAIGDNPFYGGTYRQTVYELNKLREQGKLKLPEDITDEEFNKWVKAVATAQGLEAVYQDSSELSQGAMDIKNGIAKCSKGFMGFDPISNTSMPFVSTPMNVVKSNLELSPLGIVKNAVQTVKEIRTNLENNRSAFDTASFDQRRFVRETSRNAVGTLMFAVGLMMKNAGLLTGGYSDDDREKQAQKDAGMQEYALVSPFTGNQWSINWIPGAGSTLIAAAAFDDAYDKPDQSTLDAVLNGSKAGAQSLFEQAALQGLQRLTGSANYSSDNKIVDNVVQTVANTASSAILPSIVRQTAAALDPYKRNTYGMGGKESIVNNAIAGVPFLRQQLLEPRIGMNGEPIEQNAGRNTAEKWFDNLVNPALVTVPSALENPVRDEASRLYEETKDPKAFQPKISLNYLKVDDHIPTTKEYTEFLQIADKAMNQAALDLMDSDYYDNLSSEQKVEALNGMYSTIQKVERANYLDLDTEFTGADKAYAEGGEEGLINYIIAKSTLNEMGLQNNPANRDKVIQKMDEGGSGAVQEMVDQAKELEEAGLSTSMQFSYEHATKYMPSLSPSEFAITYNEINTDGNTSIKQSEVIDYLNKNPDKYDSDTALQYWYAFDQKAGHDGQWKKIPVLDPETGLWKAK